MDELKRPRPALKLTEKQRGVLGGMVLGLTATLLALAVAITAAPEALLPDERGAASAMAHALQWDVLLVFCLAANIAILARHRFLSPADIDGGGLSEGTRATKVLQSVLQNTLEQMVFALSVHFIWAVTLPWRWQAAIPAAAMLFFLGRGLFWRGYARGAPARALGFALTFYPTLVMLLVAAGHLAWTLVAN